MMKAGKVALLERAGQHCRCCNAALLPRLPAYTYTHAQMPQTTSQPAHLGCCCRILLLCLLLIPKVVERQLVLLLRLGLLGPLPVLLLQAAVSVAKDRVVRQLAAVACAAAASRHPADALLPPTSPASFPSASPTHPDRLLFCLVPPPLLILFQPVLNCQPLFHKLLASHQANRLIREGILNSLQFSGGWPNSESSS